MPSYVNIGAWVGPRTMVDTWATVGSCAQIGADVHLAGGVGIGGVLEPPGARPVIVEDGAFVGSRCIVTEGTIVGEGAVLGANVVLTSSIPIIDVTGSEPVEHRGYVPPRSVVIPVARQGVPGRDVRHPVRADRRHAQRVDRPEDEPERRAARTRDRDVNVRPVRLLVDDDRRRSRLTVFFRFFLAIPHFVWLGLWTFAVFFTAIAQWFVTVVRAGRPPLCRASTSPTSGTRPTSAPTWPSAGIPFRAFSGSPGP